MVPFGQGALDFNGALSRFQCAAEFNEESVADGFDFRPVKARKDFTEQAAMFFQQLERKFVIALRQRTVADHVREHDRS